MSFPPHRRFRGIECSEVKIYDLQKVTFPTLFKLYIAELGVLISKRYHNHWGRTKQSGSKKGKLPLASASKC